ncbi:MAG: VOC family protein [Jatrophihabitantaceae bacterium]
MTINGFDHVQVAIPANGEASARGFYGDLLGLTELVKSPALAVRGGCWFTAGSAVLHLGVEDPFVPARKAHPAFRVDDLSELLERLGAAGCDRVIPDPSEIPGVHRFHAFDPFGNRVEFVQLGPEVGSCCS